MRFAAPNNSPVSPLRRLIPSEQVLRREHPRRLQLRRAEWSQMF